MAVTQVPGYSTKVVQPELSWTVEDAAGIGGGTGNIMLAYTLGCGYA